MRGRWTAMATALLLSALLPLSGRAHAAELEASKAQLKSIQQRISNTQQRLDSTGSERGEAQRTLRKAEQALADTHQRIDQLQQQQQQTRQQLKQLGQRQKALEAQRHAQQKALGEQMRALYEMGRQPRFKMLLNGDDPTELERFQRYLDSLNEARAKQLARLETLNQQLADNQRDTRKQQQQLSELLANLQQRQQQLTEQRQQRQKALAKLDQRYQSQQSRLSDLKSEREEAESMVDQLQQQLAQARREREAEARRQQQASAKSSTSKAGESGLTQSELAAEPATTHHRASGGQHSKWPVDGRLLARFGQGDGIDRNGVLIAASAGTPVRAVAAGQVVFAHWMRSFGNLVIIEHDGVLTLYAHNQSLTVSAGDRVDRGAVIAHVGDSGGRHRPALYFEVRRGGRPIDPDHWLARR
ncbi:murein hydrolase activator EnvC family protein [Kushneria phosphatilytica]|nr:peptidoglycan DD-metalloendopeptidase family protein [Kushneria phosphatilytica]